ncbi:MAG: DUF4440 domain-containing protein [Kordiimonadales bacterium]|nr:MAG: DUF4440 domain-containing protein [Kordiimonadales bacterium]
MTDTNILKGRLLRMEAALADPEVRVSEDVLKTILHVDFAEIGKSGTVYSRDDIIAALLVETQMPPYDIENFSVASLSETIAIATYTIPATKGRSASIRSSVWVMEDGIWLLRFHQGTPTE